MARSLRICVSVLCLLNIVLELTDGLPVPENNSRICVIGAGYSGLAVARYLNQFGAKFTVYEATKYIGGTWRFDPHVGVDEDGLPLFTSMYKELRTNTPRQTMEYNGFPFPPGTPSFPSGPCFYKYLQNFTKKFELKKHIQYRSWVNSVEWAGDRWNVSYTKTDTRTNVTDQCHYLIIAVGQYSRPLSPKWNGMEKFKGKIIHSHDYKESQQYSGRRVLVVGAGPSGLDLALHLVHVAARLVHSHHLLYTQPNYPDTYVKKPDIKEFTENGVVFEDGSFEEVDDVILCTGYEFAYPFVKPSSGLTVSGKFILPLHQHIVNIRHPTMMFVGNVHKVINRVLDVQAEYAASVAVGRYKLPSQNEMLKTWLDHVYSLKSKGLKIVHVNVITDMDNYFANLTREAGVTRAPPVLTAIRDFNGKNRLEDWLNYRSYEFEIIDDNHYDRKYKPIPVNTCPISDVKESETSDVQDKVFTTTEKAGIQPEVSENQTKVDISTENTNKTIIDIPAENNDQTKEDISTKTLVRQDNLNNSTELSDIDTKDIARENSDKKPKVNISTEKTDTETKGHMSTEKTDTEIKVDYIKTITTETKVDISTEKVNSNIDEMRTTDLIKNLSEVKADIETPEEPSMPVLK